MSMMKFPRKGYGRLFVEKKEDIEKVKEIMKEIDPDEFEGYFIDDLIAVFSADNCRAVYTHKFDEMDMGEVMIKAWSKGIKCFCILGTITGYEDL